MHPETDAFRDAIAASGMTPPDVIEPGRFYRFPGAGKHNGNTAGWCKLFPDGMGGTFGDYARDFTETWQAQRNRPFTFVEREGWRQHVERAKAEAEAKRRQDQAEAAKRAASLWDKATPAEAHPYLAAKNVNAHGVRVAGDTLLVPMRNSAGDLANIQRIAPDGSKRFLRDARVTGCYHSIGRPNGVICVAEGYATGASIHEATGHAVAVAFNAVNLESVANQLSTKYPAARLIVCADDDAETPGNPGWAKANNAARAVRGFVAVPHFGLDRPEGATDFNDLARHAGAEAVERAIANAREPEVLEGQLGSSSASGVDAANAGWAEPLPLIADETAPPYPLHALPAGIREAVVEVVDFLQCPAPLAVCSALSALSLAAQALADVRRASKLTGPTSLYVLAIADSGERKTTCDGLFMEGLREWEREQQEQAAPDVARYAAALAAWEERRAGVRARIKDAARKEEPSDDGERELARIEAERPPLLRVPRLIHSDATPEALAWSLAHGWPSGGVMSSEAGIVFGGHGMGRESVMRNLALLNALWEATTHRVERRSSDSFTLAGARLTMGLAAQPETVRQFMEGTKGLARGNGFAARFLIAAPASTQGSRLFKSAPEWRALLAFGARLRALLALPVELNVGGTLNPPALEFDTAAAEAWRRFHDDVEREQRAGGDMAAVRDVASKAADNAARLAALFHVYTVGPAGRIGVECVQASAAIVGWHLFQARAFLDDVAAPREASNARRLDAWLIDRCRIEGTTDIARRTAQNEGPNPTRNRIALDLALDELTEAGRIRQEERGRRKLIVINPALLRPQ